MIAWIDICGLKIGSILISGTHLLIRVQIKNRSLYSKKMKLALSLSSLQGFNSIKKKKKTTPLQLKSNKLLKTLITDAEKNK